MPYTDQAPAISWAAIKRKYFPVPKAIHTSALSGTELMPILPHQCQLYVWKLSYFPLLRHLSSRSRMINVSASSCKHGASPETSLDWLQSTSVRCVLIICLLQSMDSTTVVARKEKISTSFIFKVKPLLNGHLSNSQQAVPLFTVNLTSIKWSPLLSGRGHHLEFPIG